MAGNSPKLRKTYKDGIPDWVDLDMKYWRKEEKHRYGVPIDDEDGQ